MTKPKPKPTTATEAIRIALDREEKKRPEGLKPIEIVKVAISAYQAFVNASDRALDAPHVESDDRAGLRRGMQASVDRLLFNVNYWRAAYEDRIVAACSDPDDARACLAAICAWNSHTMKLNTLPQSEVVATFERFCPPLVANNRRGSKGSELGKGPVSDFCEYALALAERETPEHATMLQTLVADVQAEAHTYTTLGCDSPLEALYDLLPAWCLQDRIELVTGTWWDNCDVMSLIAERLYRRFTQMGFGDTLCTYFIDSFRESLDEYLLNADASESAFTARSVPELLELVRAARAEHADFETQGYDDALPCWLSAKEQLIWNTIVCAIFGPLYTRPLLADSVGLLPVDDKPVNSDVITKLAERAYADYLAIRRSSGVVPEFGTFELQPADLRNSGLERIESIPEKLRILGYRIVPTGSCYPEQRVLALTPSEVECLAVLEHRRWLDERTAAGWTYNAEKNVAAKQSPYLLSWEELPERAREWNRSAIRDIPTLLANVGLAIAK